jgi:hypothetical protein
MWLVVVQSRARIGLHTVWVPSVLHAVSSCFQSRAVARSTYVKELVCCSLFLQIDLVRVSQTFGRHIERLVSGVVDFLEKPRRMLSKSSSSKQGSTKQIEETEEPKKQHLSTHSCHSTTLDDQCCHATDKHKVNRGVI